MNNDKEQITSNEKSEDVLADLSKDEHSGEETSSPESSGKKTFTDTDGSDSVNTDVAAKPSILRRIVLIAAICVFCYSAFMLFQIFWEYKKGNDIYDTIQNQVLDTDTPTSVTLDDEEVEIPFVYDHKQLLSINPEGLGYLYIPSIDVRLPMVQSTDNDFYLTHTFNKTANKNGCLFEDYRITDGLSATRLFTDTICTTAVCLESFPAMMMKASIIRKATTCFIFTLKIKSCSTAFSVHISVNLSVIRTPLIFQRFPDYRIMPDP